MAVISSVAYAEKGDNTAPPSAGEKPAVFEKSSYFHGTWVGNWRREDKPGRHATITVGPKNPDGTFDIEYSWGAGKDKKGHPLPPGTVKTKGREDGEKLTFEFSDPELLKTLSIVMTKHEDGRVKARLEGAPHILEAYLKRR
jgi:hypothetical protein